MDARSGKAASEGSSSSSSSLTTTRTEGRVRGAAAFDIEAEHRRLAERFEAELERYRIKPVPRPGETKGAAAHGDGARVGRSTGYR